MKTKTTSDGADNLRTILDAIGRDSATDTNREYDAHDDEYGTGVAVRWLIQAHAAELQELIDVDPDWYEHCVRPMFDS